MAVSANHLHRVRSIEVARNLHMYRNSPHPSVTSDRLLLPRINLLPRSMLKSRHSSPWKSVNLGGERRISMIITAQMAGMAQQQQNFDANNNPQNAAVYTATTEANHLGTQPPVIPFRIGPFDGVSLLLSIMACTVSLAISFLFVVAIPTIRAMKRTAEAFERLADTMREELPATMAAVRLSGMEISDLTMELSDLSQEISEGVKSSARAMTAAETGLRRVGHMASTHTRAALEERAAIPVQNVGPAVASAARTTKDAVVRVRQGIRQLAAVHQVTSWFQKFRVNRGTNSPPRNIPAVSNGKVFVHGD